ncbi:Protein translocase subunit SecA [Candidatus Rhabdochlamydia oedothoracis]|uniref:Protein translocase subunit SecA n=1 Tax=Candidatus Rhabdochlamydia oedothoracis TaxID=2720720 RepID=A0ABX8UYD2_9BACT|nr:MULTISPECIES: preprotein translocase subunit SecA [Rhabdochlamydia]KAG6559589.1 Protein translocase subunit SecA [Candidatus Rhabdochlamydia sp. W815]QYF47968.1 Protein translocase subunit SecA [Candidatus Rhabdochlamydia oedothoracis]
MLSVFKKIFGTSQSRLLKRYQKTVVEVNRLEKNFQQLSHEEVRQKTAEFKARYLKGETLEDLIPEAYAVVKNACRRLCGTDIHVSGYDQKWDMIPYDVQILAGIAMHHGAIAEMQTGEGKTLTASMPLYLNACTGKPVHLVTVNDYLAERDCQWIGTIFRWLGLNVTALTGNTPHHIRNQIYAADIVYGTASEFGFDYLRDNSMAQSKEDQVQRGYFFAIVDEIDSILIDEARTPLIISGPASHSRQMYDDLKDDVYVLVKHQRDSCNHLALEARKILEKLHLIEEKTEKLKVLKTQEAECEKAFRNLWLVSKGMPQNRILKKLRENPKLRAEIEKWDTYFYAEPNKEERHQALAELLIIVDERANEFELTDKGIQQWIEGSKNQVSSDDFVMLDLGHEYANIDQHPEWDEQEKRNQKILLREEDARRKERSHNLRQLLRAHLLMENDVDYIIENRKIVIIDENTGRPQPGRRFADGLHQAIEAKEGVTIQGETQTYATVTLQNYFRLYTKLAGMTGTAMTEANEFKEIYKLDVLAIPTHHPCIRKDYDDEIYMTEREKYHALVKDIQSVHSQSRPILIGTESVEASEKLSRILKQHQLEHTILNAKNHAREAEIIAEAGSKGAITVATNMAGRGTDIKLKEGVAEIGGLYVVATTRHQSRRIDRQLRGRGARQGDPGSSKFYVSFEDSLMRLFTSPRITIFLQRFRPPEGEAITAKVLNKSIETAQKRVEQRNYNMRKHTLEYDDVMNKQREEIYSFRNEVLHIDNSLSLAREILESICIQMCHRFFSSRNREDGWDPQGYTQWLHTHFPLTFDIKEFDDDYLQLEDIEQLATQKILGAFEQKIEHESQKIQQTQSLFASTNLTSAEKVLCQVVRGLLIRTIDRLWQEHLLHIDHLRSEVHLRAVGQKDPLMEFKHEAFALFDLLSLEIKQEIAHALFKFTMVMPENFVEPNITNKRPPLIDLSQINPSRRVNPI